MVEIPAPPAGTRKGGKRLWTSIVAEFELEEHELALLREAVRAVDQLDQLAAIITREGVIEEATGRAHPALTEARQLKIALARVLAALRLPSGDEDAARPQRRTGVRGPYALNGGGTRPWGVVA